MWDLGVQKMWDQGFEGPKINEGSGIEQKVHVGSGILGVKKCGIWDSGGEKMWDLGFGYPCKTPLYY